MSVLPRQVRLLVGGVQKQSHLFLKVIDVLHCDVGAIVGSSRTEPEKVFQEYGARTADQLGCQGVCLGRQSYGSPMCRVWDGVLCARRPTARPAARRSGRFTDPVGRSVENVCQ